VENTTRRGMLGALGLGGAALATGAASFAAPADVQAPAARYVDAFFANIHWEEVGRRAEWAAKAVRG
jgi:hypothetical protein